MSTYKEFQGKTLDEAIEEACRYYGVEREKLEIEIVSDAKGGIFGLMGSKKASIRAARAHIPGIASLLEEEGERPDNAVAQVETEDKSRSGRPREGKNRDGKNGTKRSDGRKADAAVKERAPEGSGRGRPREESGVDAPAVPGRAAATADNARGDARPRSAGGRSGASGRPVAKRSVDENGDVNGNVWEGESSGSDDARQDRQRGRGGASVSGRPGGRGPSSQKSDRSDGPSAARRPQQAPGMAGNEPRGLRDDVRERIAARNAARKTTGAPESRSEEDSLQEDLPTFDLDGCDQEKLFALIRETVTRLVTPIVGEMQCTVAIAGNRVKVTIDCGESSGLLVGREGQTLAAVQYLAVRIIARTLGGTIRLQFDAGNYRERQDERLHELALSLAEKVKSSRRSMSTRPLSAYQRRIVHLSLEQDPLVQTFSKGEGAQRRVVVQLRRSDAAAGAGDAEDAAVEVMEFDAYADSMPENAVNTPEDDAS